MTNPVPTFPRIANPDLTRDLDLTPSELVALLELADRVRTSPADYAHALDGRSIMLLFEKPSFRTRLTFELAIQQLGGFSLVGEGMIGDREPLKDMARNLERWVSGIVARTFRQKTVDDLAHWSNVPVINALSDMFHPCQALADMQTLRQVFGKTEGLQLTFVGDGNNMSHSLMLCAPRLGTHFTMAHPPNYAPDAAMVAKAKELAAAAGTKLEIGTDPYAAVKGSHAVYTDVWASMGAENEAAERRTAFANYQVDDDLMNHALPDARFMHCLPAKRGEEVTDSVMESKRSVAFQQAENRLHAQKAALLMLL